MKPENENRRPPANTEEIEKAIREDRSAGCALLCALLDSAVLFQESEVPVEKLKPLWDFYGAECGPEKAVEDLGLFWNSEPGVCTMPDPEEAAHRLGNRLAERRIHLAKEERTLGAILDGFTAHCREELGIDLDEKTATWGGRCYSSADRCHHVLIRPHPVLLRSHPHAFFLLLCHLPPAGIQAILHCFVDSAGLRQRLALVDLEVGYKINLTRSDVFVHFERYLRRKHGLRLAVHPELTKGLVDGGILKLEKG